MDLSDYEVFAVPGPGKIDSRVVHLILAQTFLQALQQQCNRGFPGYERNTELIDLQVCEKLTFESSKNSAAFLFFLRRQT